MVLRADVRLPPWRRLRASIATCPCFDERGRDAADAGAGEALRRGRGAVFLQPLEAWTRGRWMSWAARKSALRLCAGGGEIAAMVMLMRCAAAAGRVARRILTEESFADGLWSMRITRARRNGAGGIPPVLLSGHHCADSGVSRRMPAPRTGARRADLWRGRRRARSRIGMTTARFGYIRATCGMKPVRAPVPTYAIDAGQTQDNTRDNKDGEAMANKTTNMSLRRKPTGGDSAPFCGKPWPAFRPGDTLQVQLRCAKAAASACKCLRRCMRQGQRHGCEFTVRKIS